MRENSTPIDVIGEAYGIAANYLKQTGRLAREIDIHQPLLDSIAVDFRAGKTSKLVLANRAIVRFEKIGNVLEWLDAGSRRVV
jgi:hypothetical protein